MILAVDTGGTKTLLAEFDGAGHIVKSIKYPTPADPSEYINTLYEQILAGFETESLQAISIATPGFIEDGVVKHYNKLNWTEFEIVKKIKEKLPGTQITLLNDAKLGALGVRDEAPEAKRLMYLTLSTGIGSGMVVNGRLSEDLIHSESGKITLYKDGGHDTWEHIASGKAFYEKYGKFGDEITDDGIWQEYAGDVMLGLATQIATLQPDTIIIGGSMGRHFHKFGHHLERLVKEDVWESYNNIRLLAARHPEEAVIFGCYNYAKDKLTNM